MPRINPNLNKDVYSTTEIKTNKIWIDGKPIYKTVYQKTVNANITDSSTDLYSLLAYDSIWINYGDSFSQYGSNTKTSSSLNYYISSSDTNYSYINGNGVLVIQNKSSNKRDYYITLEYTKTTN